MLTSSATPVTRAIVKEFADVVFDGADDTLASALQALELIDTEAAHPLARFSTETIDPSGAQISLGITSAFMNSLFDRIEFENQDLENISEISSTTLSILGGAATTYGASSSTAPAWMAAGGIYALGATTAIFIVAKLIDLVFGDDDDFIPLAVAETNYELDVNLEYSEGALSVGDIQVEDGGNAAYAENLAELYVETPMHFFKPWAASVIDPEVIERDFGHHFDQIYFEIRKSRAFRPAQTNGFTWAMTAITTFTATPTAHRLIPSTSAICFLAINHGRQRRRDRRGPAFSAGRIVAHEHLWRRLGRPKSHRQRARRRQPRLHRAPQF